MTANIYHDEAIIRSVTYSTRGGHKVSFELDPEGWERLKGMETTRCMMVLVPIQNDGQPDPDAATRPADKPKRRMAELRRAQQAGILCSDDRFIQFLIKVHGMKVDRQDSLTEAAARKVRSHCKVNSRSRLDSYGPASVSWDQLRAEYDAWTGKIGWPEPARAGG